METINLIIKLLLKNKLKRNQKINQKSKNIAKKENPIKLRQLQRTLLNKIK